jgi:serine/threonine protein kinase
MEYLAGETLAGRLTGGALPIDQALALSVQAADALTSAHRTGIVHRDLKPSNIMLTKTGAKLLDFGLAKTAAPVAAAAGLSTLPTSPPDLTAQGTILGTFQYMAPEQLEGRDADTRTDIFAFGALLYEMLTGTKAFRGKESRDSHCRDSRARSATPGYSSAADAPGARPCGQEVPREGSRWALAERPRSA